MKYAIIDSLTLPLRWFVAQVMALAWPDYFDVVLEEAPLIARRNIEAAIADVGLESTDVQFAAALSNRLDALQISRPDEHRILAVSAAINGFEYREALWRYEFDVALQRRGGE